MSELKMWERDILNEGINRLGDLSFYIHALNANFYHDIHTGKPIERNVGELTALIHSEVSEMLEGLRKDVPDDHLPHRKMAEVECVDILIRVFDLAGYLDFDLEGAMREKLEYNRTRKDHTHEARRAEHGKKF